MSSLQEIGLRCQTDKASHHRYLPLYDVMFQDRRAGDTALLEIGVQFGNSLRTWSEYFKHGWITGIDSVDNGVKFTEKNIDPVIIGDAYCEDMLCRLDDRIFDIIVDDGSHAIEDQIYFVSWYPAILAQDGVLIVEDVLEASTIQKLADALPGDQLFSYTAVEMVEGKSQVDSRLFIAWRKL